MNFFLTPLQGPDLRPETAELPAAGTPDGVVGAFPGFLLPMPAAAAAAGAGGNTLPAGGNAVPAAGAGAALPGPGTAAAAPSAPAGPVAGWTPRPVMALPAAPADPWPNPPLRADSPAAAAAGDAAAAASRRELPALGGAPGSVAPPAAAGDSGAARVLPAMRVDAAPLDGAAPLRPAESVATAATAATAGSVVTAATDAADGPVSLESGARRPGPVAGTLPAGDDLRAAQPEAGGPPRGDASGGDAGPDPGPGGDARPRSREPQPGAFADPRTTAPAPDGDAQGASPARPGPTDGPVPSARGAVEAAPQALASPPGGGAVAPTVESPRPAPARDGGPMLDLYREGWGRELGQRVVVMAGAGVSRAEVRVNPAHLGPLTISIDTGEDGTRVQFTAAAAGVREALEQTLPRLRELFQQQGLALADASVDSGAPRREQSQSAAPGADEPAYRAGTRAAEAEPAPGAAPTAPVPTSGIIDTYV